MDVDFSPDSPEWFSNFVEELKKVSKRSKNKQYKTLLVVQKYFTRVVSQIGEKISILEILSGIHNVTNFIFEAVSIITHLREANYEDFDLTDVVPNFMRTLETLVSHLIRSAENESGSLIEYTNSLLCCFLKIVSVNYNSWFYSTIIKTSCLFIMWIYEKRLSPSEKKQLTEVVLCYMDGLLQALNNCGDYECQSFILEIILNLVKLQQIGQQRRIISQLFPNLNRKEQSSLLIDDSPNYGTLLNELNFLARSEKTISSVEVFSIFIGEWNVQKHSESNKHWINFSHKSKRVHFKADIYSDSKFKKFDVNIELSQIESVCTSPFPKESLTENFNVLHIYLKSDIASISNELLSQAETNCRSVHVVYEDFDVVNEAIEKMGYTSHEFDAENELCCYPKSLWLWSSVYPKNPNLTWPPLPRCAQNEDSFDLNMENCRNESEESEYLSSFVRCVQNEDSFGLNMENCRNENEESENLSPLVRRVQNEDSFGLNIENCRNGNEESENLSPLVRCVQIEDSFGLNIENCRNGNEESENLSPLVRRVQIEDSFGLNIENCRNENEVSENLSPLVRSLDSCRSKENEFPVNHIHHALFQQRITADTSCESQEIYPATPNTSVVCQPYFTEERFNKSDNEAVRLILTSTTAESCFEDPFPRSLRRNIMEGVELTISISHSENPPLTIQEDVEPLIHPPEVPGPCIHTPEESEHYIQTSDKPGPCIRTPEGSGPFIPTPEGSGPLIPTPEGSGPFIPTPEGSGPFISTPGRSGPFIPAPEHLENYISISTPVKPRPYIRTRENSKVPNRVPCYLQNKENVCTLSQGTDPYIPRCVREWNITHVVKPKRSRPVPTKMKTVCRPLPIRKVSTKTEKKRNVERLKKHIIRLENKLHKLQSGIDQLELELAVAREELLNEERAAGGD